MDTRKLSFRLLLALTGTVFVSLLALSSCVIPDPTPTPPYMACERYNSRDGAREVWLEHRERLFVESGAYAVNLNNLWDENGQWIEGTFGIVLRRMMNDLSYYRGDEETTLECLEGIPVQTVYDSLFQEPDEEPRRANTYTLPECTSNNTPERREEIYQKYESRLRSYPNVQFPVGPRSFWDENMQPIGKGVAGITMMVYPWVDPDTLPPEDRIPDCLEGIPIQILEGSKFEL